MVSPLAAGILDDDITEKLCHQFLALDLGSLFLSFIFIKLVRYADQNCPGGALPVPVHVLGEELCACGVIPEG